MKIAEETNMMIIEMKGIIMKPSINNWTMNATNILRISEDLQYLIQRNMKDWAYQIQRMLANELDVYKEQGNQYIDDNIQEIQELYKDVELKKELNRGRIEDEEVILIKPYKELTVSSKMTKTSFICEKIKNLEQYMKFIHFPMQMRLFRPPPHYQLLHSKGEQNPEFWKEVMVVFVDEKHNTKTLWNGYPISMYQGGPSHEPYFITIDNWGQTIIGPTKKIVTTHIIRKLKVLV